ncbi:hypothetical protein PLICRDRAFT_96597 [Plicaturopsis crispa FD-325 SS-3]|nr:hypothetical protein PLICRDRAFT_96597 [Plicaturopsis crispa FD-325 SS-3]
MTRDFSAIPQAASSSSAFSTSPSGAVLHGQRSPSPPASAYFPVVSQDTDAAPEPTPGADQHFAYSSTLRRHSVEGRRSWGSELAEAGPVGLWQKAVDLVTGSSAEERLESGNGQPNGYALVAREEHRDTPSAYFAHQTAEATFHHFQTSDAGLASASISALQATHGYNEFSVSTPEPLFLKFAKTIYESPLILLLCGSAAVSAIVGNVDDAVSIGIAVLIVLTVGFVQEQRSEKSLEALNKLVPHHCHVIRDGRTHHILANELVPGDVVTLSTGDRVPADLRLVAAIDFEIDESSLTGETESRRKEATTEEGPAGSVGLADRRCVAYMGTLVRSGRATGIVIATGTKTEFGVIFSMMQDVEEKRTPLQLSMDELAKNLSMISFGVIGVICVIGVLQQRSWLDMFTIGVSLAVAAIPEGLPIVTTVTLALGVLRMSKRSAIVKKLHSVEALGSVSVVCSDKTGTLTENAQTVKLAYAVDETQAMDQPSNGPPSPGLMKTYEIGCLCNNSTSQRQDYSNVWVGQSTDVALMNLCNFLGIPDYRQQFDRITERPFSSEHKYMSVSGRYQSTPAARETYYIKGSIESILPRCKSFYVSDDSMPTLDSQTRAKVLGRAQAVAKDGLRVIVMALGFADTASSADGEPSSLVFVGFVGMMDPPRHGVADSIALLQSGGIQVVMITGDAEETALSIARSLGLGTGGAMSGATIDGLTPRQLREQVGRISVFARTTPRHKMKIVEAFQARGAVVAMTGDGVNDAPALKMADIGVSMGKSGTDVAKEAADVILVDDNFSTILPAVEEGMFCSKSIFHNIQNFVSFQLSTAAAALTLITLSTLFGLSNPLNAMQILFINILMDGPPAQSLGVDPVDPSIMRRPPRKKNEPVITRPLLIRVLFSACIIVIGTLFIYVYALSDDKMSRREQTMTFTTFVFLDLVSALQNRSLACAIDGNRMLLTTVSISFLSQLALIYFTPLQAVFQTEALGLSDLSVILGLAAASATLHEVRRRWERDQQKDVVWAGGVGQMA